MAPSHIMQSHTRGRPRGTVRVPAHYRTSQNGSAAGEPDGATDSGLLQYSCYKVVAICVKGSGARAALS